MAGADRVEGTLFGNGERTGNVDIVTLALNLLTQGVDPKLDLSQLDAARRVVEECNELPVHPRHPWAGELVYTAFSGSHQDAIKKGIYAQQRSDSEVWDVPYLPIDPNDLGRSYEAIIRINSQSGKGGVAYLLLSDYRLDLPRGLQVEFSQAVQAITDAEGGELSSAQLYELFDAKYLSVAEPYELVSYRHEASDGGDRLTATLRFEQERIEVEGQGNGPIAALIRALDTLGVEIGILDYHEHALGSGEDATAAAYVEADVDGEPVWGVAIHSSIVTASLRAVVNAVNRGAVSRQQRAAVLQEFEASVTADRVMVLDTTLRDGEQSAGVALTPSEKVTIALQLERLGVDVVEAGFPAASDGEWAGVARGCGRARIDLSSRRWRVRRRATSTLQHLRSSLRAARGSTSCSRRAMSTSTGSCR